MPFIPSHKRIARRCDLNEWCFPLLHTSSYRGDECPSESSLQAAAYEKSLQGKPRPPDKDGFTPEQRFFLGWAQVWGANQRIEYARLMANTNPHPLGRFRGNGPLSNMSEFAKAFGCNHGEAMVREQACKIW